MKVTQPIKTDFYVTTNFKLPSDGLLELTTLKSQGIIIYPQQNSIMYCGNRLPAMKLPKPLATLPPVSPCSSKEKNGHVVEEKGTDTELHCTIPSVQSPERHENVTKRWNEVKATVLRDHEIPDHVAKRIPICVPDAIAGSDYLLGWELKYPTSGSRIYPFHCSRGTCH